MHHFRRMIACAVVSLALLGLATVRDARATEPAFITMWGSGGTGPGQFNIPVAVAIGPSGDVYVVDENNERIQRFTNDGVYLGQWGGLARGTGDGQFTAPVGIAVDEAGIVYVADGSNNRIQKFSSDGTFLGKWGTTGTGPGQFMGCHGVAVKGGVVYTIDDTNNRMQMFTTNGDFLGMWTNWDYDGFAVDDNGFVYAVGTPGEPNNTHVHVYDPSGVQVANWATGDYGGVRVAVDHRGHVFVNFLGHHCRAFTTAGQLLLDWGSLGSGPGQFNNPIGIGVDSNNDIFVCDTNQQRIEKFGPGAVPTLSTTWGQVKARYR